MTPQESDAVIVLGGSWQQCPLVEVIRRRGLRSVVFDGDRNARGAEIADDFRLVDIADADACVREARSCAPRAVITTGTDWAIHSWAAIGTALDLAAPPARAAAILVDKERQAEVAESLRVPIPQSRFASTHQEVAAAADVVGFPLIVKPIDASGSRGVRRVDTRAGLQAAAREAVGESRSGRVVLQEVLTGVEFGCQVLVTPDGVRDVWVHNDDVLPPPLMGPLGHSLPFDTPSALPRIHEIVSKMAGAFEGFSGVLNFDFFLRDAEPVFLEVSGRLGGGCLPALIKRYSGTDLHDCLLLLALDRRVELGSARVHDAVAAVHVGSPRPGLAMRIDASRAIYLPGVTDVEIHLTNGSPVRAYRNAGDAVATVFTCGVDADCARGIAQQASALVRVEVTDATASAKGDGA